MDKKYDGISNEDTGKENEDQWDVVIPAGYDKRKKKAETGDWNVVIPAGSYTWEEEEEYENLDLDTVRLDDFDNLLESVSNEDIEDDGNLSDGVDESIFDAESTESEYITAYPMDEGDETEEPDILSELMAESDTAYNAVILEESEEDEAVEKYQAPQEEEIEEIYPEEAAEEEEFRPKKDKSRAKSKKKPKKDKAEAKKFNFKKAKPAIIGGGVVALIVIVLLVFNLTKSKIYLTKEHLEQGKKFNPLKIVALTDSAQGKYNIKVKENNVNIKEEGEYKIIYTLTNKANGKEKDEEQKIIVKDTLPPEIKCKNIIKIENGEKFNVAEHVEVADAGDGKISAKNIEVEGDINTKKAGEYPVTFKLSDSKGNTATKDVVIEVAKKNTGEEFYKKVKGIWISETGNIYEFTKKNGKYIFKFAYGFNQGADSGTLEFVETTDSTATVNWTYKSAGDTEASKTGFFIDISGDGEIEVNGAVVRYAGTTEEEAKKNASKLF